MKLINGHPDMTAEADEALRRAFGPGERRPVPFRFRGQIAICTAHEVEECSECLAFERQRTAAVEAAAARRARRGSVEAWRDFLLANCDGLGGRPGFEF